ncbi:MAG: hypothetical protein Q8N23_12735 [Archangium sp.]|nr:hypothetical protein [Archangium sp.]MDP3574539.1 hypothetical protein [Archangium sp.]
MLAGKAGGALRTGRHVDFNLKRAATNQYPTQSTLGNLFTSVLNLCGFPDTGFGGTFSDDSAGGTVIARQAAGPLANLT